LAQKLNYDDRLKHPKVRLNARKEKRGLIRYVAWN